MKTHTNSCLDCISACKLCKIECLKSGAIQCVKFCEMCIAACELCALVCNFDPHSELHKHAMEACYIACLNCHNECKKHSSAHCKKCAAACLKCCNKMNKTKQQTKKQTKKSSNKTKTKKVKNKPSIQHLSMETLSAPPDMIDPPTDDNKRTRRGTCPACGWGVFDNDVRLQDDDGTYWHQDCYENSSRGKAI